MDSKTQKSYTDVWLEIKKLYFKFHRQELQLKMVHLDFEKAVHNAVLEVFENCQVVGCRFHLSQAWFRHIKNNKELNRHYDGKTVVYQWLQSF
ncbi:MULE domain-containing protein [Aphis craccivora]|uniref:MULE domain-containing protein n=1 Tax=Aphis craccivora TaxID=307492 RepID=A0A6G0YMZ8_APHCR|nr:MULE domain-containing protein [Aphis craccivora]